MEAKRAWRGYCGRWSGPEVFGLSAAPKIYLSVEPVDMRKSFEGLYGLVRDWLEADPKSGHLLVLANRDCTREKVLLWDVVCGYAPSGWTRAVSIGPAK